MERDLKASGWEKGQSSWKESSYCIPNEAHNGYLETYLTLGLIGVFLLIGLFVATFRKIRLELFRNFEWGRYRLGFLAAVILYNWTEAAFRTCKSYLVCFLSHCYGLSTNLPHDWGIICRGCEIRREQGIRVCGGGILTAGVLGTLIASKKFWNYGKYFEIYRGLAQTARAIQLRFSARLLLDFHRGAVGRAAGRPPSVSGSPFQRGAAATAFVISVLSALLLLATGATQAKTITALSPSLADVSTAIAPLRRRHGDRSGWDGGLD